MTLGFSDALAQPLEQPRERGVLLDLHAQVAHAGVVQRFTGARVDGELVGAENLESFLERLRRAALARADLATSLAGRGRLRGARLRGLRGRLSRLRCGLSRLRCGL